jgi:hypothetical protein
LDEKPFPSDEFGPCTTETLAKAATVMLPYPPPASGRLFIGINPDDKLGFELAGAPKFFLRLVQVVSQKQVITRIIDLKELRWVSLPAAPTKEGTALREFEKASSIARDIKAAVKKLTDAEAKKRGVYEVLLFEDAVIYVPEWAPVFLRIQYEFGVSAVEAAENVDSLIKTVSGCSCPWQGQDPYTPS